MSVRIIGTGSYLPKKVADNNFLSTIVDTDDEWIRQRTGIKERHLSNGKEGTTYMAAHAAEAALENAGIGADELDMIIVATVSADTYVPSTSCSVQGAIGAIRANNFFYDMCGYSEHDYKEKFGKSTLQLVLSEDLSSVTLLFHVQLRTS